jgi:serine/threonine-protein kinase RsbT
VVRFANTPRGLPALTPVPRPPEREVTPPTGRSLSLPPPPSSPPFLLAVTRELARYVSDLNAVAIVSACATTVGIPRDRLGPEHINDIVAQVRASFSFFGVSDNRRDLCLAHLRALGTASDTQVPEEAVTIEIEHEYDIVRARHAGRELCVRLGFSEVGSVKVATAISELARNIFKYAGRGYVTLRSLPGPRRGVEVVARDNGPGIPDLEAALKPNYRSSTGMGAGLRGTRSLMDSFDVVTRPGRGTVITVRKLQS